ncbi:hypothetical protein ME9_00001, partial [Bartonella taylorii 8TBB]
MVKRNLFYSLFLKGISHICGGFSKRTHFAIFFVFTGYNGSIYFLRIGKNDIDSLWE